MASNRKESIVAEKSFTFALDIIKICNELVIKKKEYVLSRQLLKSGTSIGANIEDALGGQSKRDLLAKIFISYKEARETHYWIRLLRASNMIDAKTGEGLLFKGEELIKLLSSIRTTVKNQLKT